MPKNKMIMVIGSLNANPSADREISREDIRSVQLIHPNRDIRGVFFHSWGSLV